MAVRIPQRRGVLGFDIPLVHSPSSELPLGYHRRRREAFFPLPQHHLGVLRHIALFAALLAQRLGLQILVHQRRILFHGAAHIQHRRQHFVVHLYQFQSRLGHVRTRGGHRRQSVALVEHLVQGQNSRNQVLQAHHFLAQVFVPVRGAAQ